MAVTSSSNQPTTFKSHLLQSTTHLTMQSGTRKIFNVLYSNQVVDLQYGSSAEGTPIVGVSVVGCANPRSGRGRQQYYRQIGQQRNRNLHEGRAREAGKNMQASSCDILFDASSNLQGQGVFGSTIATKWTLVKQNDMGQYM